MLYRDFLTAISVALAYDNLSIINPDRTQSVQLKPLTPIAGTNLFLNLPYKWHDRTKPGCFATWFWENYLEWFSMHKAVNIVCSKHDQKWYDTEHADWIFERTEGEDCTREYSGTVKIKNVGSGNTLKTMSSVGTWWVTVSTYNANPAYDMWNVRTHSSDKNYLQLEISDYYLAQTPAGDNRSHVYVTHNNTDGYPYSFVSTVKLAASMYNFEFIEPLKAVVKRHTSRKNLIDGNTIYNDHTATLNGSITLPEKVTNEFFWGFSESLNTFSKVTGSVGIPFLDSTEVEADFDFEVASHQDWTNSIEKTFDLPYEISIPPHTKVKISVWYDIIKDISMKYTATVKITGNTSRISVYNYIVDDSPASGELIRKHLDHSSFDWEILEIGKENVIARIKGTLVASVAVRCQLTLDKQPMRTSP